MSRGDSPGIHPRAAGRLGASPQSFAVTNQPLPLLTRSTALYRDPRRYVAAPSMAWPAVQAMVTAFVLESIFFTVYAFPGQREALGSVTANVPVVASAST